MRSKNERSTIDARFERREGRWEVVSPVAGGADAAALDAIAHVLTSLPREGSVDGSVGSSAGSSVGKASGLEQYGLGANARVVRFEVAGATKGIRIGKATPVGGHVYVARLADDDVAYVESYRVNPFNHALDDLRDRRIPDFDALDVRTLRVSWPSAEGEMVEVALALSPTCCCAGLVIPRICLVAPRERDALSESVR